ncbi:unnamed protein product [Peniophora sp. CBMAI 1063]|nr:unnamed protein product [Peniophora sp. CBMAI 1063]
MAITRHASGRFNVATAYVLAPVPQIQTTYEQTRTLLPLLLWLNARYDWTYPELDLWQVAAREARGRDFVGFAKAVEFDACSKKRIVCRMVRESYAMAAGDMGVGRHSVRLDVTFRSLNLAMQCSNSAHVGNGDEARPRQSPRQDGEPTPMSPFDLPHTFRRDIRENYIHDRAIPANTTVFPHEPTTEPGEKEPLGDWEPFTHPSGYLYFYHQKKRIWTTTYMYSRPHHRQIEECVSFLESQRTDFDAHSSRYECVVNATREGRPGQEEYYVKTYYYIDHDTRSVFWLHENKLRRELGSMPGSLSMDHIYHRIQELYWRHIYLFPHADRSSQFTKELLLGLLDCVVFNSQDCSVFSHSTCMYTTTQLDRMRDVIQGACKRLRAGDPLSPDLCSSLACIHMCMARQRFYHMHGQPYARLCSKASIFTRDTSWLSPSLANSAFFILNFALLGEPIAVLRELEAITVDGMVLLHDRKKLLVRLFAQWGQLLVLGTVMLAVNMSLLAIPDIFSEGGREEGAPTSKLYVYLSVTFSLASITAALAHIRYTPIDKDPAIDVMAPYNDLHWLGPRSLALLCSTPFAFLLMSMIMFVLAIFAAPVSPISIAVGSILMEAYFVILMVNFCVTLYHQPRPDWVERYIVPLATKIWRVYPNTKRRQLRRSNSTEMEHPGP